MLFQIIAGISYATFHPIVIVVSKWKLSDNAKNESPHDFVHQTQGKRKHPCDLSWYFLQHESC